MKTVCSTTSAGRDPNREDVADAFEDGIAECHKHHWKPSEAQLMALHSVIDDESDTIGNEQLKLLYSDLKKLM